MLMSQMERFPDNAKYLKVTVHDNDFTAYWRLLGTVIQQTFFMSGKYPTEDSLEELKPLIAKLWSITHETLEFMTWFDSPWQHNTNSPEEYIMKQIDLQIIDRETIIMWQIKHWGEYEDIYIPLFDGSSEIIIL